MSKRAAGKKKASVSKSKAKTTTMSSTTAEFTVIYNKLKAILKKCESKLLSTRKEDDEKYLQSGYHLFSLDKKNDKKKWYFGGIYERKKGISLHLMPAYCNSELLKQSPPQVQKLLNGKACFLIAQMDSTLEAQLKELIQKAYSYHIKSYC